MLFINNYEHNFFHIIIQWILTILKLNCISNNIYVLFGIIMSSNIIILYQRFVVCRPYHAWPAHIPDRYVLWSIDISCWIYLLKCNLFWFIYFPVASSHDGGNLCIISLSHMWSPNIWIKYNFLFISFVGRIFWLEHQLYSRSNVESNKPLVVMGLEQCMCLDGLQPHIRQWARSLVHQLYAIDSSELFWSASVCHFNICRSLFWVFNFFWWDLTLFD